MPSLLEAEAKNDVSARRLPKLRNNSMELNDFIAGKYPLGIGYLDAVQLCLWLHCSLEFCPPEYHEVVLNKQTLASAFAKLYQQGSIKGYSDIHAVSFGAHFHDPSDKGHWLEIIASIYKKGVRLDYTAESEFKRVFAQEKKGSS